MRYEPRLRRYLSTLGARDSLLEDAAQMTLEEAFRSWPSLRDHPRQDAWLFKVARQRYAKAYKEHLKLGDLTDPVLFDRLHQDDATAGCDRRLDLLAMLRRIPEQQCEAVAAQLHLDPLQQKRSPATPTSDVAPAVPGPSPRHGACCEESARLSVE
ncbi:RNA polymerase sigma factor [Streptomyces mirabilis]|uniref:RNA polymerase sigma factor n=1 Tax=Streptomyces mirabilis TaxID=68239 RepID=UPI0036A33D79